MYVHPFQISMETLVGCSPMLGHKLEDRGTIRDQQDWDLLQHFQARSSTRIRHDSQKNLFAVAPLDVLVANENGRKIFHLIEINGTGIGGLTNISGQAVSSVLDCLANWAETMPGPAPVVLVASSGKESNAAPRLNKLLHEKILYCEALKRGFQQSGREADVVCAPQLQQESSALRNDRPAIVLGYMKDLLDMLRLESDGRLSLAGRPVAGAVNDRFCLNVLQHFGPNVDLERFQTMNRGFLAGADKGVAYDLLNDFLGQNEFQHLPDAVHSEHAADRQALIAAVRGWLRQGRKPVIKPQGTGLSHGIEFFLDPHESAESIAARIDRSIQLTEEYYQAKGGAFPYTVCEFIDTCAIDRADPLQGHKYEVRVVVYRDGNYLKAFPSITKISCAAYDARCPSQESLINNITASAEKTKQAGVEFMRPLCNRETLDLLGISSAEMTELCAFATRFIRYTLDQVQDAPERFGLPRRAPVKLKVPALAC